MRAQEKSKYLIAQEQEHGLSEAIIYTRVSSKKQASQGNGLQGQETSLREYARFKNYDVIAVFQDDISGAIAKRSGMDALLSFIRSRKNDPVVVLFDDISRLARDVDTHRELKRKIRATNCWLETPSFAFRDDADSELNERLQAQFAEHMKRKNAERTFHRMRARLLNGYWPFQPPRGYKHVKVKGEGALIERNEPIATITAEALNGFAFGRFETQAEIKRFLEGQPTYPKCLPDGTIRNQRITELLTRVFYAGYIQHDPWDVTLRKGRHEPLITLATYEKIQERLKGTAKAPARVDLNADFPLRGFILCGDCGHQLTSCWSKGRTKNYPYYLCRQPGCASKNRSINRDKIHGEFEGLLDTMRPTRMLFDLAKAMFSDIWDYRRANAKQQVKAIKQRISELDRKITGLIDRLVDAGDETLITAYEDRIADLNQEKALLTEKQAAICKPKRSFERAFRTALSFLANPKKLWNSNSLVAQRALLRLTFADQLAYCRKGGFRTVQPTVPFQFLGLLDPESEMAHPRGFEPLASAFGVQEIEIARIGLR